MAKDFSKFTGAIYGLVNAGNNLIATMTPKIGQQPGKIMVKNDQQFIGIIKEIRERFGSLKDTEFIKALGNEWDDYTFDIKYINKTMKDGGKKLFLKIKKALGL